MLDQMHRQFIDVVKKGRGKRLKDTPDLFSGLFWTGQQAVELGLADQLGNLDFVAREVIKAEELVDYTRRENVAERLAKNSAPPLAMPPCGRCERRRRCGEAEQDSGGAPMPRAPPRRPPRHGARRSGTSGPESRSPAGRP